MILPLLLAFASQGAPNILVVILDDVGWIDLSLVDTPSIDHLASQGRTYQRFYVTPLCSPSRSQIFYGVAPAVTGMGAPLGPGDPFEIPAQYETFPRLLRGIGYSTAVFGKVHTVSREPADVLREFGEGHAWTPGNLGSEFVGTEHGNYYKWLRGDGEEKSAETTYATTAVTDAALEWIALRKESPWCAVVAYHAVHAIWEPVPGGKDGTERELLEDMLAFMDLELGRLLGSVDLQTTLVYLVSDNGTPDAEPDPTGGSGKGTLAETGIRVPLIVAGWDEPKGVSDALVCADQIHGDILSRACGTGSALGGETCFVQRFRPNGYGPRNLDRRAAILASPWVKLIRTGRTEQLRALPSGELLDPEDHPEIVARLRKIMAQGDPPARASNRR